ncbi:MAG: hypothetical protein D6693_09395 [Planctomycetota bacterium]|nr:MAG: hypothetical protein D6693_09395 [Planctomycetota bacterium]
MRAIGVYRGVVVAAPVLALAAGASAVNIDMSTNAVANVSDVTGGLVGLDLTGIVTGLTTTNSLTANFSTLGFSGTVTASVFGNQSTPGAGLNSITIVYEFASNSGTPLDSFEFGLNSGNDLNFADYSRATIGTIGSLTTVGQANPNVTLTDGASLAIPGNTTLFFDFLGAGDTLANETFGWYIQIDGAIVIDKARVEVRDFGSDVFDMLAMVNGTGQPDLGVPAPGALGVFLGAGLLAGRRRRRG